MTTLPETSRGTMLDALTALLDGGHVELRSGAAPDPDDAATGSLLATITLNTPAFGAASAGTATADTTDLETTADATGTAGWARAYTSADAGVVDFEVGDGLTLSSVDIVDGTPVQISSMTLTMPDGS